MSCGSYLLVLPSKLYTDLQKETSNFIICLGEKQGWCCLVVEFLYLEEELKRYTGLPGVTVSPLNLLPKKILSPTGSSVLL